MMWTIPDPALRPHRPRALLAERAQQTLALPLYDAAGARSIEQWAAASRPVNQLMQIAGLGVARLAWALAPQATGLWAVAGPGNNGGDAIEAACHWHRAGRRVVVSLTGTANRLPADAAQAWARAQAAGVPISDSLTPPDWLSAHDVVLDGLLGRGLQRPARGPIAHAIEAINRAPAPVLAIDLPSGLPGDTGALPADAPAVQARWTLALLALPPGLFTARGRDVAGDIWWDDLAVQPTPLSVAAPVARLAGGSVQPGRPDRHHSQHKGSFGDVWVVAGAARMGGAAVLAARSALHAGAGRVYVAPLHPITGLPDSGQPELMQGALDTLSDAALNQATVVAGCGGGDAIAAALPRLIAQAGRLVLDADALNAIAADAALLQALRNRQHTVITPHPLEAARLLRSSAADVQSDRLLAARSLAQRCQATVVLKGSGSIVAAPGDELPWIVPVGNAALATPGSGDVLAGWLGGLWSQWRTPESVADVARLAVWQHGWAAETISPDGLALPASALIQAMAR